MTLHDYLAEAYPDLSWFQRDQAFGARIDTTRQTIGRYRSFQRYPTPELISRIRDATRGLVTADDLLPPHLQESAAQRARRLRLEREELKGLLDHLPADVRELNRQIMLLNKQRGTAFQTVQSSAEAA